MTFSLWLPPQSWWGVEKAGGDSKQLRGAEGGLGSGSARAGLGLQLFGSELQSLASQDTA